jgi:integrase
VAHGGRKPRAQSTLDEYTRHLKRWWEWTCANLPAQSTTPTLRGVNAYTRVIRERSEHAYIGFLRAVKAWTTWLVDDGTLTEDPLASLPFVKPPKPHPDRTPVAELADLEAQIATCTSNSLEDVRDRAIILVLAQTAMRRGELARMTWDDVDLKNGTIYIPNEVAKNGRGRTVGIEADAIRAIFKYQRTLFDWENRNKRYPSIRVWLGRRGPLNSNAVGHMLARRSTKAGVRAPAHAYRRGYAVRWLRTGNSETLLKAIAGWDSPEMIKRYTSSVVAEEALVAQRAFNASQRASLDAQRRLEQRRRGESHSA